MPRKEYLAELRQNPEKLKEFKLKQNIYWEKLKNDPVRHEKWKTTHRNERNRHYHKHKQKINEQRKIEYMSLSSGQKKLLIQQRKEYRIKKRQIIIKSWGNKCQNCGYSDYPEILQFDHKIALYRRTNNIKKKVSDHMLSDVIKHPELFQLLCPNCHILKTRREITELWKNKIKK